MSDTPTPYGDIKFTVTADTSEAAILRQSLAQVSAQINNTVSTVNKLASTQAMLQRITAGTGNSTKVLTGLIAANNKAQVLNNKIISDAVRHHAALTKEIDKLGTSSPKATAALSAQANAMQRLTTSSRELTRALQATSIQQWANRAKGSLTQMNMSILRTTAQTLAFTRALRTAFFSFADLEQESARVTKLMVDNFGSGEEAIRLASEQTKELGKLLDQVTRKFGTSRVLVQSLAGDFAELGIGDIQGLKDLVELTTTVEKLGNVDIEQSQRFVESMLQNILRVKREQYAARGLSLDLTDPKQFSNIIAELRGQLAEFNLVENKTSLSLKDLADAFPEVSAAATTFGLSMTESAALLAPMVASGFQVGASANSIKVSLQRMVAMTKQNSVILGELNQALGPDFDYSAGVSMENIQKLTDGFNNLLSIKGEQGTLELFARLFGVRQGPRMETSFRQLAVFQKALGEMGTTEARIAEVIQKNVNARLKSAGFAETEQIQVKKMVDISNLHRKATENINGQYTKRAKIIREGQKLAFDELSKIYGTTGDESKDFLSKIGTESGKILMSSAFRIEDVAQKQLETELQIGLDTTITKFRIMKEEILAIGRVIVTAFKPLIEFFTPIIQKIRDFVENLGPLGKKAISFGVIFLGLIPSIKLLTVSFRWFFTGALSSIVRLATGFGKLGSRIIDVTELVDRGAGALKNWQKATSLPGTTKVLLSGRKRGAITDVSGLDPSTQQVLQQGSTPTSADLKNIFKRAIGLPVGGDALTGLDAAIKAVDATAETAADAADAAATTAKSVSDGVSEALKAGFKGTVFTSNRFMGNTFTGGPGGGGTGRGPRTPGSPRTPTDTRPTYGPPAPGPVYGPAMPPPDTRPTYGPPLPSDARPIYGPSLPPSVTGTSKIPAGGFRVPTTPVLPSIPGPEPVKKAAKAAKKAVKKTIDTAAASVATATATVGAAVADVSSTVASVAAGAAETVSEGVSSAVSATKTVASGSKVTKAAAQMTTLKVSEIVSVYDKLGVALPDEYQFLRSLDKEWQVATKTKQKVLKDIAAQAKGGDLTNLGGPLGRIERIGKSEVIFTSPESKRSLKPTSKQIAERALRPDVMVPSGQDEIISDLLEERLKRVPKVGPTIPAKAKPLAGVIENLKIRGKKIQENINQLAETGMKAAERAAAQADSVLKYGATETKLLADEFKGLTLTPKDTAAGVIEVEREVRVLSEYEKAVEEARIAQKEFEDLTSSASQQDVQRLANKAKATREKVVKLEKTKRNVVRTATKFDIVPAAPVSQELQNFRDITSRKLQLLGPQRTLLPKGINTQEQVSKALASAVAQEKILLPKGGINQNLKLIAGYRALMVEKIEAINKAIDSGDDVIVKNLKQIGYKSKQEIAKMTSKTSKAQAAAQNRELIRKLAAKSVRLDELDPESPAYDPNAGRRLFTKGMADKVANERIMQQSDSQILNRISPTTDKAKASIIAERNAARTRNAAKEADILNKTINQMTSDYTVEAQQSRSKAAAAFKKTRNALIKKFGSIEAAEVALSNAVNAELAVQKGALSAPTAAVKKAVSRTTSIVASGTAAVKETVDTVARTASSVPFILKDSLGGFRMFHSAASEAVSSSVVASTKTIGSEISRLLDDVIVRALPAGFDPAKAKVIRSVIGEVLAKTPITAGSAAAPAAQKFMSYVLGDLGGQVAGIIKSLEGDITKAISIGGISAKGGIIQTAKTRAGEAFRNLAKKLPVGEIVGKNLRAGIEAAVFDAVAAAGYAIESTTSSIGEAIKAGTFTEAMIPGYLDELTTTREKRSARAVESGSAGAAAAAEARGEPISRGERNAARRRTRALERLVKEGRAPDLEAAGNLYDEALAGGKEELDKLLPKTKASVGSAVKEAVGDAAEAAKETASEAVEAVGEKLDEAVKTVSDATTGAIDDATKAVKDKVRAPSTKGMKVEDMGRAELVREKGRLQSAIKKAPLDISVLDEEITKKKALIDAMDPASKGLKTNARIIAEHTALVEKRNALSAKLASSEARLAEVNKRLAETKTAEAASSKKAKPAAAAAAAGAAPTGAPRAPRIPTAAAPAASVAAVTSSAVVEKLDEVIIEFDRSLANFFKGPNFFQGPNYFAGPITAMPNAKFKDVKKRFSDLTDDEKKKVLSGHTKRADEAKARILARKAGATGAGTVDDAAAAASGATAATAAKAGLLRRSLSGLGGLMGSGLVRGAQIGKAALQGMFGIVGKSASEFWKMSAAFINMYTTAISSASSSSRLASISAMIGAKAIAVVGKAAASTDKAIKKLAGSFLALGRTIATTTNAELARFFASLQKSKILKAWGFLLFTGMLPLIKGFKALTIGAVKFITTMKFSALIGGFQQLYQTVLRTALSFAALAIKLNAAMLMIAPILILVFSIISKVKRGISGLSPAMDNFKAAWVAIKDAIYILAAPLENLIASFGGIGAQGDSVKRTAGVIWLISKGVRAAAEAFQRFAAGPGLKYMKSAVVPIITRIVNRFILLGRAISAAFGGRSGEAAKNFKGFLYSMLYEAIAFIGKFINLIASALEMFAPTLAKIIDAIVAATITAFRKIMNFAKEVMLLLGSIITVIGGISGQIGIALGGAAIVAGGVGIGLLDIKLKEFEESAKSGGLGAGKAIANGITSGAKKAARGMETLKALVGEKYGDLMGVGINTALASRVAKDMPKDVKNAMIRSADDARAGGESLGQEIAKGIKKGLADLKSEFTDKFFGKADSEIDKFVEKLKDGLNEQKDKALEAFDNQIEAIEALGEAEERLTATVEYEEKRREMIRERALDRENYLRERKVAAYEGRAEDVRSLDLTFRKSSVEKDKELKDFDLDRVKTLQAQNREDAVKVINKQKEQLIKEYDKMFKDFDQRIEDIKVRGFSNEQEFVQMFGNLQNAASVFSDDLSSTFMKAMESLPNAIRESTDPSIGMFSTSMDKMVQEAKRTFGIGVTSASSESILGAAYFLAKGMPGAFRQAFDSGIVSQFVTPFSTKVKNELNNTVPADLWVKSAGVAMVEMVNEMKRKLVSLKGTLYDDFKKLFSEIPVTDLSRIFGDMFKDLDSEALKDYFANLFPTAEELKAKIITIETVRSKDGSGGGEAPKASPGFTPSELGPTDVDYSKYKDYVERMAELREKAAEPAQSEKQDPKQSFFGKFKDIIVGIADYLGPVKTAILGALGIVAGAGAAIPIWTAIKGLAIAIAAKVALIPIIIGTVIGTLIYLYARFESVRNVVNGIAIAIWNGLVAAFNFLKDIGVKAFDGIKIGFLNLWDGFTGVALPKIGEIWSGFTDGFSIAFDWIKEQIGRRVSVLIDIIKALIDPLKDYWEAVFKASFNLIKSFFENVWNIIVELFATLKVIFEPIIKIIVGVFIIITEAITILWEKLKTPIITIATFIIKTFTFLLPIFSSIGSFIFDVIGGAIVGLLKIIKFVFEGVYKSVGTVVNVAVGIAKAIFNVLNAIWTNPVVKWIRDFLFRVLMLGIFIVASLLEAFAKTIFNAFKTVFNIFKNIATFIYNTLKPGLELIWNVVKFVFTPVISIIKVVIDMVKWLYGEFGILGPVLAPFVAVLELIRRIVMIVWNVVKSVFKGIYSLIESAIVIIKIVASAIWDGLGKVWGLISPIVNAFWDGITTAAGFVWDLLKTIGSGIWDVLGSVWDVIGSVATKFWDGLSTVAGKVWEFIKIIGKGIWDVLGYVWDKIGNAASFVWDGIKRTAQIAWDLLKKVGQGIWDAIGWVWNNIDVIAIAVWDGIKIAAQTVWDFLKTVGTGIWNAIGWVWDLIAAASQKFWDLIAAGWELVGPIFEQLWEWLWNGINYAWDTLKQTLQFYWDLFKEMWGWVEPVLSQLWEWLWNGIKWAWDQLVEAVQFYWDLFKQMWGWIEPVLSQLWDWLWTGIKFAWDKITEAVQFMWEGVKVMWSWIQPVLNTLWDLLWNGIKLAWDGITTAVQFVWDKIKAMWNAVLPVLKTMWEWIKDKIGAAVDGVKGAWNGLKDAVSNTFNWFKDKFSSIGDSIREGIGGAVDWVSDKLGNIPNLFKGALNAIIRGVNNVTGFSFTMPDWLKYVPGLGGVAGKTYSFRDVIPELPQVKYNGGKIGSYMKGGMAYGYGGMTSGFPQQAVPAILHGGEYIINHKAAQRIGTDTLDALNNLRLSKPRYPRMPSIPGISMPNVRIDNSTQVPVGSSTSNVNIYVDNFIGEPEWFNSMMKDYNMKVAPRNQKAAGLENRVIRTYNGLNRGM